MTMHDSIDQMLGDILTTFLGDEPKRRPDEKFKVIMSIYGGAFRLGYTTGNCYQTNIAGQVAPHEAEVWYDDRVIFRLKAGDRFPHRHDVEQKAVA